MRKHILPVLISLSLVGLFKLDVNAATLDTNSTAVEVALDTAKEAYEESVVARIVGRAGSATQTGAKGITFEQLFINKENVKNFLKGNGIVTKFTKSSTAQQVDVIAVDEAGKVVARYQLKDTPSASGIYDTIKRVEAGQYTQAQLIGTTETAEAYASKVANNNNISKIMQDAKISTKTTEKIAEKALSKATAASKIIKKSKIGAYIGGAINGGIALGESIYYDSPLNEAIGYVSTETTKGAISCAAAEAISTGTIIILTTTEAGTVATVAVPIVVAAGTVYAADYCLDYIDSKYDIASKVSETAQIGLEKGDECIQYLAEAYVNSGMDEKVSTYGQTAKEKAIGAGEKITSTSTMLATKIYDLSNK